MPRVKRGFKARRRRNRILNQAEGFCGGRKSRFRQPSRSSIKAWEYALHQPQAQEARLPPPVDRAHQRRRPHQRHDVLAPGERPQEDDIGLDRKILSELAIHDPAASAPSPSSPPPK